MAELLNPPGPAPDLTETAFMEGLTKVMEDATGQRGAPATVSSARQPASSKQVVAPTVAPTAPAPAAPPKPTDPPKPAATTTPASAADDEPAPTDLDPAAAAAAAEPAPKPTATDPVPNLPARGPKNAQWQAVKASRDKALAEVTRLQAELKSLQDQVHPDFDAILKERDNYKNLLREVAVERDPEIAGPLVAREKKALAMADAALPADFATADGLTKADVLDLLQKPPTDARDEALSKVLEGMGAIRANRLDTARRELEDVQEQRRNLAQQSQAAIARRQEAEAARRAAYTRDFQTELSDWTSDDKGLDLLRPKPGDDAHNARAKDIIESAQSIFNGAKLSPRQFARAAFQAVTQPHLAEQNYALTQKVAELESVITKMKGVTGPPAVPSGNAGQTQVESTEDQWDPAKETLPEYQVRMMQKQGLFAR